jgi:serine/threonine protein kinase
LTPRQRLELFVSVCQAVQHAHQKGIIHRDLKPSNVLVSRHDTTPVVRVIDFGVAKALDQVTMTVGIKGTPVYMSPEQIGGETVGPESDLFSWAATMIYGGTGRMAFAGANQYQVFQLIMAAQPDLSGLPDPLLRPIAACLDKDPRNRPKASELIAAITG